MGTINGTAYQLTSDNYSTTATIDTGSSALVLPYEIYATINNSIPTFAFQGDIPAVYCDEPLDASFALELTGIDGSSVAVDIPYIEFLTPLLSGTFNDSTAVMQDGRAVCTIALGYSPVDFSRLGDPFIRSTYLYFNLDQHTISIASPVSNITTSDIVAVGQGPIPSLTGNGANVSVSLHAGVDCRDMMSPLIELCFLTSSA